MKGVLDQELKSVRKSTTETTALKDNTDSNTDLVCLDSIERMDREVLRFKNALDNMWLKNTDFIYTKENF